MVFLEDKNIDSEIVNDCVSQGMKFYMLQK